MWSPPSSPPPNSPPPYSNSNSNNNSNRPYSLIDLFKAFRRHDEDEISLHLHEFPANGGFRERTILMEAILLRNAAMVHYLLTESEPADPNKVTHLGPALFVVNPHDIQIYEHLLDAGADPTKLWKGLTIVDRIIITPGAEEAAEFFLKMGILPNTSSIYQAIESSSDKMLNLLFNYVDLSNYQEFISYLIRRKNPALLRQVVESDLDFQTRPAEPALLTAVLTGEAELLAILLETGKFDLNQSEEKAVVHEVIDRNRPDMLDLLFRASLPPRSAHLRYAIEKKAYALANLFVVQGTKLSQTDENEVVIPMIDRDDVEMLEFLHNSGLVEFARADLQYAIEKNKNGVALKLISYDIPINTRILYTAAENAPAELFEQLMNRDVTMLRKKLSFKDNKTLFELAQSDAFRPEIKELILYGYRTDNKYKGFTRGDLEITNLLFDRAVPAGAARSTAENFAMCPICLKFTERGSGCKYMLSHDCRVGGGYYHRELYERFKSPEGYIYFCTVCGRICLGHRHYDLKNWNEEHTLMHNLSGANPFSSECKSKEHGGDFEEKIARFRKLRSVVLALQPQVGIAEEEPIKNQIVQSIWNPMIPDETTAANLAAEATGTWRIPLTNFPVSVPVPVNPNANTIRWGNMNVRRPIQDRELLPEPAGFGMNSTNYEDGDLFRFVHRQPDGSINRHDASLITIRGLTAYIRSELEQFGIPDHKFGKCFDSDCKALIYPEELRSLIDAGVDPAMYERYRRIFNVKYHEMAENNANAAAAAANNAGGAAGGAALGGAGLMGGGGRSKSKAFKISAHKSKPGDFFQPMVDGACLIKPDNYKPGNALPMGKLRKTRRQGKNRRATRRLQSYRR